MPKWTMKSTEFIKQMKNNLKTTIKAYFFFTYAQTILCMVHWQFSWISIKFKDQSLGAMLASLAGLFRWPCLVW